MSDKGKVSDALPILITLVVVTLVLMYITGYQALSGDRTLMNIFGEADEALSLFVGGIVSIAVVTYLFFRQKRAVALQSTSFMTGIITGVKSMISAVFILLFAWRSEERRV